MTQRSDIPRKTVYRMSLYLRNLNKLRSNQVDTVSSEALAKASGVKPTQLRKDLTYLGQVGTRGLGYRVETLTQALESALGNARLQPVILIGAGSLGSALLRYGGFGREGFEITAAFDVRAEGREPIGGTPIMGEHLLETFIRENDVKMAIVTVPAHSAQGVANKIVEAGVQAILNFSPTLLQVPEDVSVNNVDLALELENLSYFVR